MPQKDNTMEKINVKVTWCDRNFAAEFDEKVPGAVVVTAKNYDELVREVAETLRFHIEGMKRDGDSMPEWLSNGDYEIEYDFDTAALLHFCERYASLAAISRASGVNERLLSHYANGLKKPRAKQRERIVSGLHRIGKELLSVK